MKKTIIGIMLLEIISTSIVTLAHAEPAYIDCKATNIDGKIRSFSVKLDEANGKITHTESGGSLNAEGHFSAKTISYKEDINLTSAVRWTYVYTINRTTLDVIIEHKVPSTFPSNALESKNFKGSCKVVKVKDRKI